MILRLCAEGIVSFHFWGSYNETIALTFATPEDAALALVELNKVTFTEAPYDASGRALVRSTWMQPKNGRMVGTIVTGPDIGRATRQLVGYGANEKHMHSMDRSIDHGRPFTVVIPLDYESPDQLQFNFNAHDFKLRHTQRRPFTRFRFAYRQRHTRHSGPRNESA